MSLPLSGRMVVVTRATAQAGSLAERLRDRGATVLEVPMIAVVDADDGGAALRDAVARVADYDWVVVTSVNGAERLAAFAPRPWPDDVAIAAIGPGTARALTDAGLPATLVPERFVAEGLLEVFPSPSGRRRVLLAQAADARAVLADGLRAAGWQVDAVVAYRTVAARPPTDALATASTADAITFASGSAVDAWLVAGGVDATPATVVCIGPVTAEAAARGGLSVTRVASEHTLDGLVAAVVDALS